MSILILILTVGLLVGALELRHRLARRDGAVPWRGDHACSDADTRRLRVELDHAEQSESRWVRLDRALSAAGSATPWHTSRIQRPSTAQLRCCDTV